MSIQRRVGFVGLGNIGKPMALRLAAAEGVDLRVFDVDTAAVAALVEKGATAAGSVAELGNWAEVICVMVRDDDQAGSLRKSSSRWVLVSRDPAALERGPIVERGAVPAEDRSDLRTWTDDYSNLVQILK